MLSALETAQSFAYQPENGRWRVCGKDCNGFALTVIVLVDEHAVIVWTVF